MAKCLNIYSTIFDKRKTNHYLVTLHKVAQYILLVIRIRNITLSPRTYNEGLKCTITLSNLYLVSLE